MTDLAEFLRHLFEDKDLSCATIRTYRSAVSTTLKAVSGLDFSDDPNLKCLMGAFFKQRPSVIPQVPAWNLAGVLHALTMSPFEPAHKAVLKFVAWKALFLLALASGKRRSELHALIDDYERAKDWSSITLRPKPGFVAKSHTQNNSKGAFISMTIPALTIAGDEEDRRLCPVRALKWYLSRTKAERELIPEPRPLFLPLKVGRRTSISPTTLGAWTKRLLVTCMESAGEDVAAIAGRTIHELRRQATSWNMLHTNNLEHILAAGQWANHTTFTSHYLKYMNVGRDKMYRLGPIVAAQTVIVPP